MIYFADLHIHSKYSMATSKDSNLVELARWAAFKGIRVLATGDFTHPGWFAELEERLVEAGDGLYRLRDEFLPEMEIPTGGFGPADVRFLLNVEISSIYKKSGAVRKIHNLVFMPDLESVRRFNSTLDRIGNIRSDGRPILGLDSRNLLEIALETTSESFLVPAHVWTPWFSLLGSRSGFDSVEECFDDLAPHIFALETGLSSDPEMNHMVPSLDRYTLISNSDTHSPGNLGREVNIFEGDPGYTAIREALRRRDGIRKVPDRTACPMQSIGRTSMGGPSPSTSRFLGTIEFFPEEGKYHLDGHRKCSLRLDPQETEKLGGLCPVCGGRVTVGVMNRVMELAGRPSGEAPEGAAPFWRMLPLAEIASQALGVGVKTKKTRSLYTDLVRKLGPELMILWSVPAEDIERVAPEIIAEGISRVRQGNVHIKGGYDGEYGKVELFTPDERSLFAGQRTLMPVERAGGRRKSTSGKPRTRRKRAPKPKRVPDKEDKGLNDEQLAAVCTLDRPVLVNAGPGSGKTRTLAHRVSFLVNDNAADPATITAVTFSRKAAKEMRERIDALIPPASAALCRVETFHGLGLKIMELFAEMRAFEMRETILDRDQALSLFKEALVEAGIDVAPGDAGSLFDQVSRRKQNLMEPGESTAAEDRSAGPAHAAYEALLGRRRCFDLDDLLVQPLRLLKVDSEAAAEVKRRFRGHILVDEFQDVNRAQYELIRVLARPDGTGLFVIGDPDQAIYGFRGADLRYFHRFSNDYPNAREVFLTRNYRSQAEIMASARSLMMSGGSEHELAAVKPAGSKVKIVTLPGTTSEGIFITRSIEAMLGGSSFLSLDSGMASGVSDRSLGFEDFAVLYRLNAIGDALEETFRTAGIPYQRARKASPEEEAEAHDPRAEAVTLMTIHAAKGLEFPVVFVAGCEEGVIPYTLNPGDKALSIDVEEERRLLYVAMTRAEEELFLTGCTRRTVFGKSLEGLPSRFLASLDQSRVELVEPFAGERPKSPRGPVQVDLFGGG